MSNNKKQTAVEWLQETVECFGNKHELQMSWATLDELFEQAKEMDKQQIIDAIDSSYDYENWSKYLPTKGQQYYNETYND